jgi:A/G-specific adenine glycosylase
LAAHLLAWFPQHARDLPWRRTRDPYAIWVSEIMLQQTQVNTVIPYYERWMVALPNLASLARVSHQRLHKLWEGLGYYTRVRNMKKAATVICREHAGRFPRRFEEVLALPGIGRYTAGALCSIAFNHPTPILDGNVIRVLTRVFGIVADPGEARTTTHLWGLAQALVSAADGQAAPSNTSGRAWAALPCSALNQSLMELGALICTPRNPSCSVCPVRRGCVARRKGNPESLPTRPPRPGAIPRHRQAFVLRHRDRYLAVQRPTGSVNGGLWEFPSLELQHDTPTAAGPGFQVAGVRLRNPRLIGRLRHSITRYRITLEVYGAELRGAADVRRTAGRWVTFAQLQRLPLSAAHRRIAQMLPLN